MLSMKGDLEDQRNDEELSIEGSLNENTTILKNLVTNKTVRATAFARSLSYCNRTIKMKVLHHKQQGSSKKNVCFTDQKTQ